LSNKVLLSNRQAKGLTLPLPAGRLFSGLTSPQLVGERSDLRNGGPLKAGVMESLFLNEKFG
jgi:hypothetical protein